MNIKKGDLVKLVSWTSWINKEDHNKPALVWGGPAGYKLGEVMKTVTGLHDPAQHFVSVRFPDGNIVDLKADSIALADADDNDIAQDFAADTPLGRDVWVLVRTSLGNFSLSVIEALPFGDKDKACRFVVGTTRNVLTSTHGADHSLIGHALSQIDWTEKRFSSLYDAAASIHTIWDLPECESLPLPLPFFDSIHEAAESCPKTTGPCILYFHTPHALADFSEALSPAAS